MISMSVAQTAIASTRTRTSAGPGSGTGFSTSESSSGPPSTQAFIVGGSGDSLLRVTPAELKGIFRSYALKRWFDTDTLWGEIRLRLPRFNRRPSTVPEHSAVPPPELIDDEYRAAN